MKRGQLEKQIREILSEDPDSRNDDIRLTQVIWWTYYKDSVMMHNDEPWVKMKDLSKIPREDNIKRIRAKIQNEEKKYLPTNPEVAKKRGWAEDDWRSYLGYPVAGVHSQHL